MNRRLPAFCGVDGDPATRLSALAVTVIGSGSVGLNLVLALARIGIGDLSIVDPGTLEPENLGTHPIDPAAVGRAKAEHAATAARRLAPAAAVRSHVCGIGDLPATLQAGDLCLLAVDNLSAEIETAQRCLHLRQPLIQASVDGATLVAQVRTFATPPAGACPACSYDAMEWAQLAAERRFACDGSGGEVGGRPTMSIAALCSLAADLATMQVVRFALGAGEPLRDGVVEYAGFRDRLTVSPLERREDCPLDHRGAEVVASSRALGECSVGELAGIARIAPPYALEVPGHRFVGTAHCACGAAQLDRFVADGGSRCDDCGELVIGDGLDTDAWVPDSRLGSGTLSALGAAFPESVSLDDGTRLVHVTDPDRSAT